MVDFGIYLYELSEEQQRLFVRNEEVHPQYATRCARRSENMRALAHFFGCSDRTYEKHLDYKYLIEEGAGLVEDCNEPQGDDEPYLPQCCNNCDFFSDDIHLPCAVHPDLKDDCSDFIPKSERQLVKLEIKTPPEKKRFHIGDFTHLQLLYCQLVSMKEDWHHDYYCESALVDHYEKLQGQPVEGTLWDAATKLPYEEILDLQERLRNFSSEDRWYFNHAMNIFISF